MDHNTFTWGKVMKCFIFKIQSTEKSYAKSVFGEKFITPVFRNETFSDL